GALGGAVPLMVLMSLEALRELAQSGAGGSSSAANRSRRSDKGQRGGRGGSPERNGTPEVERVLEASRNGAARNGVASHAAAQPERRKGAGGRKRGPKATPERMAEEIQRNPSINVAELARLLNVSRQTVYAWRDQLGAERTETGWAVPA
ncbi:MAG: winged helix-turn-helix transcriptional regulator, partial [Chloroflexi bacterium]|nr:winged helix-turn-helix transcriptional regulator [Chloroflexota bacterium]